MIRKLILGLMLSSIPTLAPADPLIEYQLPDLGTSASPQYQITTTGKLQAGYLVLHTLDWMQTLTIARNPDRWHETNPILGNHPSVAQVNQYFLATGIAHTLITAHLPQRKARLWLGATSIMQLGFVMHNRNLGIGLNVKY